MIALPPAWLAQHQAWILPLALLVPVLAAALVLVLRKHPNAREASTVIAGLVLATLVALLWPQAQAGLRFDLWTWLPGLSLSLALEPLGLVFALVAAFLWPVTTIYALGYMRGNEEAQQPRFYCFFALAIAAAIGIAFAANLLTLFLFYEVLTLSTWPLVAHKGDAAARSGGRLYLLVLLSTSIGFFLPALVWTYALSGTTDFRAGGLLADVAGHGTVILLFALFLFGIGKAALMPFHRWLPAAMVAPTPVSALLHAVAVVKAGVFSVLKISVYIFGIDLLSISGAGTWLSWAAAFTLLAASVIALRKDNLKARLAYSTISQLAYIVLAATLATGAAVVGGALHIVMHAVGKITLFFCAGAIYTAAHRTKVSELDGLGRKMPFTFLAFGIASLSIIGLPPLGGAWSKWYLLAGAAEGDRVVLIAVLAISSLLSIGYLAPVIARGFFGREHGTTAGTPSAEGVAYPPTKLHEAPLACVLPLSLTALGCIALFFGAEALVDLVRPIAGATP